MTKVVIDIIMKVISAIFADIISAQKAAEELRVLREIKDAQDANNVELRDLASVIDKLRKHGGSK